MSPTTSPSYSDKCDWCGSKGKEIDRYYDTFWRGIIVRYLCQGLTAMKCAHEWTKMDRREGE